VNLSLEKARIEGAETESDIILPGRSKKRSKWGKRLEVRPVLREADQDLSRPLSVSKMVSVGNRRRGIYHWGRGSYRASVAGVVSLSLVITQNREDAGFPKKDPTWGKKIWRKGGGVNSL